MKRNMKLFNLAFGALTLGALASCTAESGYINDPESGNVSVIKLAKDPEIYAYSNGQAISSVGARSIFSRAAADTYTYNFPAAMDQLYSISVPSNAVDYNTGGFQNDHGKYVIKISSGTYNWISYGTNNEVDIYIDGTVTIDGFSATGKTQNIYITEDSKLTLKQNPTSGNWNIFNAGELTLENGTGANINNIYNANALIIGNTVNLGYQQKNELKSNQKIYSKGGTVTFNIDNFKADWGGSMIDIMGTLICDNIVKANGYIKFQNSQDRDICWLQADGLVEITDNTNIFGQITAPNLQFDGASIKLHPDGLIDIANEIVIHNSGCHIYQYNDGSKGLVVSPKVISENPALSEVFDSKIYVNTQYLSEKKGGIQTDVTNGNSTIEDRFNKITKEDLNLSCGDEVEPTCPKCGHPEHDGYCPDCEEGECAEPDDEETEQPENPGTPETVIPEHVEVNLSIDRKKNEEGTDDYLPVHLSIHLRAATDVEIFIPLESQYYCQQDDLMIVEQHVENLMWHGGPKTLAQTINGETVRITFEPTTNPEGIKVTTDGMSQKILDFLMNGDTKDGLTFEAWFYTNTVVHTHYAGPEDEEGTVDEVSGISIAELQSILNQSTVKFLDKIPDLYVNAFNKTSDGSKFADDCTVTPDPSTDFQDSKPGWFYNNSTWNELYYRNGFTPEASE